MISARAFLAAGFVVVLLFSSLGVSALSTWKETSADFPFGQNINTTTAGGKLVLAPDPSMPGNWTEMGDLSSPPPRYSASMVYDSVNGQSILFGGESPGNFRNDTWTYNSSRNSWAMMTPPSSPDRRMGQAMAYDSVNGVCILFGGNDGTDKGDTWSFVPRSDSWTEKAPITSPMPRLRSSMDFATGDGVLVLFGGEHSLGNGQYGYFNDTWTYNIATDNWVNRSASPAPAPRAGHSLTYDPVNGVLVLFGGHNETAYFKDTWTFDLSTNAWTQKSPSYSPASRAGHTAAYDASTGTVVLFGGDNGQSVFNDTWAYNASSNAWISKLAAAGPSARSGQSMIFDQHEDRLVLFGGRNAQSESLDDFWSYDYSRNAWSLRGRLSTPEPRIHLSMAYDDRDNLTLLFGGLDGIFEYNDTWLYDSSKNIWTRERPANPPAARHDTALAYDDFNGIFVLFGGMSGTTQVNDTWTYNVSTNTWTQMQPQQSPPAGSGYVIAYDSSQHVSVLYGGRTDYDFFNGTWTYDAGLDNWTDMNSTPSPPARDDGMMAYDSVDKVMIFFGGSGSGGVMTDTWTYELGTNTWTEKNPVTAPPGRTDGAMAFDPVRGLVMLFGGLDGSPGYGDTWSYSVQGVNWLNVTPARSPSPRFGHDMVYDDATQVLVVFGGMDTTYRGDTWLFGLGGRFTDGTYTSQPRDTGGSAYFGAITFDSAASAGETVRLQLRTGATQADLEAAAFVGPDGTAGTFYTASGTWICSVHNGTRWLQSRAYLDSPNLLSTPELESVTVSYNLVQSLQLLSPVGGENWTGDRSINWSVSDPDNDAVVVDIYLLDGTGSTPIAIGIPSAETSLSWPTADTPNGTYRIQIFANDTNSRIPLSVNVTSAGFVIYHPAGGPPPPPENHPPLVYQVYPANGSIVNSTSVELVWSAIDADQDPLNFSVFLSSDQFSIDAPPAPINITPDDLYQATNLIDGRSYYWAVIASDGRDNGTGAVWEFTVRLAAPNHDPRFTSTPPANATVGSAYFYQASAFDMDGDRVVYSLASNIDGMHIDADNGLLNWTPRPGQTGNFSVVINGADGRGGLGVQRFNITVFPAAYIRPTLTILYPTQGWLVRGTITATGLANNGTSGVMSVMLRIDGGPWFEATGTNSWSYTLRSTGLLNGKHALEARAFDGSAFSDMSYVEFNIVNPDRPNTIGDFPWSYVVLALSIIAGMALFWDWAKHREGVPPPT